MPIVADATGRQFLRHTLATLAYRAEKPLRDAPDGFSQTSAGPGSRTAGEILAHMSDLIDWALWIARGEKRWETPSHDVGRGLRALLRISRRSRCVPCERRTACRECRANISGPDCRCADTHRSAESAAAAGRCAGQGRELLQGTHRGGKGRARSIRRSLGIRLAFFFLIEEERQTPRVRFRSTGRNSPDIADVCQWVAIDQNQVGNFSRGDSAQRVDDAKVVSRVRCCAS